MLWYASMKPSEALQTHRTELREIVTRHGALRPRVFGSAISGNDTDESVTWIYWSILRADDPTHARCNSTRSGTAPGCTRRRTYTEESAADISRSGAPRSDSSMKPKHARRVPEYLGHILDAIDRATGYVNGMEFAGFEGTRAHRTRSFAASRSSVRQPTKHELPIRISRRVTLTSHGT